MNHVDTERWLPVNGPLGETHSQWRSCDCVGRLEVWIQGRCQGRTRKGKSSATLEE